MGEGEREKEEGRTGGVGEINKEKNKNYNNKKGKSQEGFKPSTSGNPGPVSSH